MWNKLVKTLLLCVIAAALSTAAFAAWDGEPREPVDDAPPVVDELPGEEERPTEEERPGGEEAPAEELLPGVELPCIRLVLRSDPAYHDAYIHGYTDRTFRPSVPISRAEAAQLLLGLLEDTEAPALNYQDVDEGSWYYRAVNTLVCGGLMDWNCGQISPGDAVTRGEFISMVAYFAPETETECDFTDIDETDGIYASVARAVAAGWIRGYPDGSFRPDNSLSRAEAAVIINSMAGRSADSAYTHSLLLSPFDDVTRDNWAYDLILEAAVGHAVEAWDETGGECWTDIDETVLLRQPGLWFSGVELYYIDESGFPVSDTTVDGLYYGEDGRYTSGNRQLDGLIKEAMGGVVNSSMSRLQKLRAVYNYTRDSYSYLRRNYYAFGDNSYTEQEALTMLTTKRGNCYCYAGVFYYMARQLGYHAVPISGTVGTGASPHGWVEIDFDGVTYIFDTELEMSYRAKNIFYYDFFMMPYNAIPWPYRK